MLKFNVGVSRKVGLPAYGSAGASCNIEVEIPSDLLRDGAEGFHDQIRNAYLAARRAVDDELARFRAPAAPDPADPDPDDRPVPADGPGHRGGGRDAPDGTPARGNGPADRSHRPASPNQVRAIVAIARRRRADLGGLLRGGYGVDRPEDLTLTDASKVIDRLKATPAV